MEKEPVTWQTYEEVARFLLDQFAACFGVTRFEGKQRLTGEKSQTVWEVDGKGFSVSGDVILIVECRRYIQSKPSQEQLAGLAYRIHDTGATGGIIVTPLGVQKGARLLAKAENILSVKLDPTSTTEDYLIQFLDQFRRGIRDRVALTDSFSAVLRDGNGNVIDQRHVN